jgi:hypothetical protein
MVLAPAGIEQPHPGVITTPARPNHNGELRYPACGKKRLVPGLDPDE